jgi:hypothetical protein
MGLSPRSKWVYMNTRYAHLQPAVTAHLLFHNHLDYSWHVAGVCNAMKQTDNEMWITVHIEKKEKASLRLTFWQGASSATAPDCNHWKEGCLWLRSNYTKSHPISAPESLQISLSPPLGQQENPGLTPQQENCTVVYKLYTLSAGVNINIFWFLQCHLFQEWWQYWSVPSFPPKSLLLVVMYKSH